MEIAKTLRIAPDFDLPLQFVTHRNAILAMSGAGKSNLAVVLAEEMHDAGVPWIAIDPKGDWWGVRASRSGMGRGLDVPVLGGEHGDLPLSPHAGALMAELVAEGKLTGVFDVSEFPTKGDLSRFLTDFAVTLLQRQRTPLHIFAEECDEYLPQGGSGGKLDPQAAICVGAWKRLAKRGRFRGLGYTLISQRAAAVNKDALYQCETLVAMRVMGKRDKDAVRGWVEQHDGADELLRSLPSLADGEAWIWSPHRLKVRKRVRVRRRETFDSGRTPEIGEALNVPALAAIDITALRTRMEALRGDDGHDGTIDDANQEIVALRETVARLERQVSARPTTIQVPVVDTRVVAAVERAKTRLSEAVAALGEALSHASRLGLPEKHITVSYEAKPGKTSTTLQKRLPDRESVVPRRVHPQTSHVPHATPPEGWTMEEESLYQKFKARLLAELPGEAPALVKLLATSTELEVSVERRVVQIDGSSMKGRLARLIADGFLDSGKRNGELVKELGRTGPTAHPARVSEALTDLIAMRIVTREGDRYAKAPDAKVTTKTIEAA